MRPYPGLLLSVEKQNFNKRLSREYRIHRKRFWHFNNSTENIACDFEYESGKCCKSCLRYSYTSQLLKDEEWNLLPIRFCRPRGKHNHYVKVQKFFQQFTQELLHFNKLINFLV